MTSFLKTLQLKNECQGMNGENPLNWQGDMWQGAPLSSPVCFRRPPPSTYLSSI